MTEWKASQTLLKGHGIIEPQGFMLYCKKWHFGIWHCSEFHEHAFRLRDDVCDKYEDSIEVKRRAAKPCQKTVFALLCAQRRARFVPKDVALIIARIVWETRYDYDVWHAEDGRKEKEEKRKKR